MRALFLTVLLVGSSLFAGDIRGFWKAIDDQTGQARCIVAIYSYQGRCYGRIVGSYDHTGRISDTIYHPVERAPGMRGNPPYCGLDFIWALEAKGRSYSGKIVDPEKGNTYNCELWTDPHGRLVVRGKLLCFGKNQTWIPAQECDFSKDFMKPDMSQFVPQFPQTKR